MRASGKLALLLSSRDVRPIVWARARNVFGADLRSLAVMRVGVAAVLIADLFQRLPTLRAHYTDLGVISRSLLSEGPSAGWSLYRITGSLAGVAVLWGLSLLLAFALLAGFQTRLATLASWVLLVSLQNRNPFVYHSGDDLLRLTLFWGMFLPLGQWWSIDAWRRQPADARPSQVVSVGTIGLFCQVLCLFVFLFDHKLLGNAWRNGTAVYDALSVEQFRAPFGTFLLGFPKLHPFLTHAVLIQQGLTFLLLASPFLIGPLRMVAIAGVIATQVGFGLCFELDTFPWIMSVAVLGLLPASLWPPSNGEKWRWGPQKIGRTAMVAFGALSILTIILWNLSQAGATFQLDGRSVGLEETPLGRFARALRLDQRWSMFAPNPQTEDGWFVLEGQLASGAIVDLFPDLMNGRVDRAAADRAISRGVHWEKPPLISQTFGGQRWLLYFLDLVLAERPSKVQLRGLTEYICRFWNGSLAPDQSLLKFVLHYLRFEHLPGNRTTAVQKVPIGAHECAKLESATPRPSRALGQETVLGVIIDQPAGLHERITDGRPDEAEATQAQGLAHGVGLGGAGRQLAQLGPAIPLGLARHKAPDERVE